MVGRGERASWCRRRRTSSARRRAAGARFCVMLWRARVSRAIRRSTSRYCWRRGCRGSRATTSSAPTTPRYGRCWMTASSRTFSASTVAGTPTIRRAGTPRGSRPISRSCWRRRCAKAPQRTACWGPRSCGPTSATSCAWRGGRRDWRTSGRAMCLARYCPTCGGTYGSGAQDTTRQAVSLWKALQTQQWRRDSDEDTGGQGLRFSFAAVNHLKLRIDEHNAAWQDFFEECGVEPLKVVYEELIEDYEGTVLRLLDGIGVPIPENFAVEQPRMKRQADDLSEEWVSLYNERAAVKTRGRGGKNCRIYRTSSTSTPTTRAGGSGPTDTPSGRPTSSVWPRRVSSSARPSAPLRPVRGAAPAC